MKKTTKTGPDKIREYNMLGRQKINLTENKTIQDDFIKACQVKRPITAYEDFKRTLIVTVVLILIVSFFCFMMINAQIKLSSELYTESDASESVLSVSKLKGEIISPVPKSDKVTAVQLNWIDVKATAYCSCKLCCGKTDGITRSGAKVAENITIAADWTVFPNGTKLYIDGIGERIVQDTGSKIKGNRIDIYMTTHSEALKFGVQNLKARVIK